MAALQRVRFNRQPIFTGGHDFFARILLEDLKTAIYVSFVVSGLNIRRLIIKL